MRSLPRDATPVRTIVRAISRAVALAVIALSPVAHASPATALPWLFSPHRARTVRAPIVDGLDPILADLLTFHPSWITRLASTHDPRGGNGDGFVERMPMEEGWRVMFHAVGEGRINRLWMTADSEIDVPRDYHELWIEADGRTIFRGHPYDWFYGRAGPKKPLVLGFPDSSWSLLSLFPIPFAMEAKIRFRGNPHYYQVDYRQGAGSSLGPTPEETARFLDDEWWRDAPPTRRLDVAVGTDAVLAEGPTLVTALALEVAPIDLPRLRLRVGDQASFPASFLFGFSPSARPLDPLGTPWPEGSSVLHRSDPDHHRLVSRLPIPLQAGETLTLQSVESDVEVQAGIRTIDAPALLDSGVHLRIEAKSQPNAANDDTLPVFEASGALQFASFVESIESGIHGNRGFLEGDEMIRLDSMTHPLWLGTGTEDYYDGGWYFKGPHSNPISGLPRLRLIPPEGVGVDDWGKSNFEFTMYRHHPLDPIVARDGIRFGFEVGDTGSYVPATVTSVGFAYAFPSVQRLRAFHFDAAADEWVDSANDAEKRQQMLHFPVRRNKPARLVVPCAAHERVDGMLVVRTYDARDPGQHAWVSLDGALVGELYEFASNDLRRWAQEAMWIDLFPEDCIARAGGASFTLDVDPRHAPWSESAWDVTLFQLGP